MIRISLISCFPTLKKRLTVRIRPICWVLGSTVTQRKRPFGWDITIERGGASSYDENELGFIIWDRRVNCPRAILKSGDRDSYNQRPRANKAKVLMLLCFRMDDELEALQSIYEDVKVISERCWEITLKVGFTAKSSIKPWYRNL